LTATALATNPANCGAGLLPRGVDASGVGEGCAAVSLTTEVTGILQAANGGTSNGFFAVAGPATPTKTFTFPNASATVLTDNALVTTAQGGTGAGTLTGLVFGGGTAALSAITSSTVGQVPRVTAANTFAFGALDLTSANAVTGALGVANGGLGVSTLAAHGLLIGNGTSAVTVSSAGTSGQCLLSNGASLDPTFQTCPAGSTGISGATSQGAMYATGATTGSSTGAMTNGQVLMGTTGSNPSNKTLNTMLAKTTAYTVVTADFAAYTTFTVASGTPFTITLPATAPGAGLYITVVNYSAAALTVARGTGRTINGAASDIVLQTGSATAPSSTVVWSDGTNYNADVTGGTQLIASGAKALQTSAIASAACATESTVTATGAATTDTVILTFASDPTAVTGYIPSTNGMLTIIAWLTANTLNLKTCNNSTSSVTPGSISVNWRIIR